MTQFIKTLIYEIKLLWPFSSARERSTLTHTTEKFDVLEQVPTYTMIKIDKNYPFKHEHVHSILYQRNRYL